ncbi:MAG: hypothetical protein L0F95_07990 [Lactococcus sp.]|nr:hypothetical protein [Lactococcus sp.]MDN5410549.1 hypothetical protein [Lactococcus sp.]MDN5412328.1 hypothetical protein [Lactococcus sp.]MDN5436965.1 hypothetical protein [Lactococcus sp.]MDN5462263.1 hypothetical protein [Lactococcus sp.]MDN5466842.1 hypothetical protein [Lactococcus sp.]
MLFDTQPLIKYSSDGMELYTLKNKSTGDTKLSIDPSLHDDYDTIVQEPSLYEKIAKTVENIKYIDKHNDF